MKPRRALFAFGVLLLCLSLAGTAFTAYSIARNGFVAAQSVSVFQTVVRIAVIVAAVMLWRFGRSRLQQLTLGSWMIAAGASALHYGVRPNSTGLEVIRAVFGLEVIRAVFHLFAYALSAAVIVRLLVGSQKTMYRGIDRVIVGVLVIAAGLVGVRAGGTTGSVEQGSGPVDARIARITNGLLNPIAVEGKPRYNLVERMEHYKVPGVSVAFFEHGEIVWAKGYGLADTARTIPVTPETRFQAASISKPVAALAALHLVEAGELSLDEDVNARLKSWKVPESELTKNQKVTLRRLLTHSAGLTVHGFPGYASDETIPNIVQVLDGQRPANTAAVRVDTQPGRVVRYSGGGFTVVQLLLTDITGKAFPALMSELVLQPAGMNQSTYQQPLSVEMVGSEATPYQSNGEPVKGGPHTYPEMAAAGLWTTPSDLGRLAVEVEKEYDGLSGKILTPRMTRQYLSVQDGDFGLGIEVKGSDDSLEFTHAGANEGYRCVLVDFPTRHQGAAIMTNSDTGFVAFSLMLLVGFGCWKALAQTSTLPA